jgi:hypothetical protein
LITAITIEVITQTMITSCIAIQKRGTMPSVTIGGAIFLAAVGAILRYAVADTVDFVDMPTIGLILMIAGIVGLIAAVALEFGRGDGRRDPRGP